MIRKLALLSALILCLPAQVAAQLSADDLRLPISLDADSTDYDGKRDMLMFRNLRLTQGNISVQADLGRATKLDFDDAQWLFSGNVIIVSDKGRVECESADIRFANHQLQRAIIEGQPATFEMRRDDTGETTNAAANNLDYDFERGIVEFSGNAQISEGGNQISSSFLVYNIAEQRINAQSSGDGGERVKITYTPRPGDADLDNIETIEDLKEVEEFRDAADEIVEELPPGLIEDGTR